MIIIPSLAKVVRLTKAYLPSIDQLKFPVVGVVKFVNAFAGLSRLYVCYFCEIVPKSDNLPLYCRTFVIIIAL